MMRPSSVDNKTKDLELSSVNIVSNKNYTFTGFFSFHIYKTVIIPFYLALLVSKGLSQLTLPPPEVFAATLLHWQGTC